jgi:hypothetical protein
MATNWDAPLTRVLSPQGARLVTLRAAGAYLSERFAGVTHSAVLEHAIELLMKAAQSGTLAIARPRPIKSRGRYRCSGGAEANDKSSYASALFSCSSDQRSSSGIARSRSASGIRATR